MSGNLFYPKSKSKFTKSVRKERKRFSKTAKQMERHLKGVANHRRIEILFLIADNKGINVEGISDSLRCNFKTISEHVRRLAQAGLVEKRYEGHIVRHYLSPYGRIFVAFLKSFSNS
jgi:predicted transcriptional regulator